MRMYLSLDHDEIHAQIPYQIVAETTSRSVWDTGRRRRLMRELFTKSEIEACAKLRTQAHSWALVKGVPLDGVKMTISTYKLWHKLADFCASL